MYMYAWEMGIKTTYYLRTLAASQVEKSTVSTAEFGSTHKRAGSSTKPATEQAEPVAAPSMAAAAPANQPVTMSAPIEAPAAPKSAVGAASPTVMIDGKEIKLCKINDPTCEACQ